MGVVYEADQMSLGRRVALKILPMAAALDPRHLQRFRLEAQAAAQLHHSNIVPIYSIGCERGVWYYAMQYVEGQSLADVIAGLQKEGQAEIPAEPPTTQLFQAEAEPLAECPAEQGPVAATTVQSIRSRAYFQSAVRLMIQGADALEYAHEMGVIHRDIKPGNLLRDGQGNVYVTDFGLAQLQGVSGVTQTGDLVGTLRYMSPEQVQAQRNLDQRTDVYSLGATLYELLTLVPAFDATERPVLLRQIAEEEPWPPTFRNPAIPADLETIVLKAMAKEPDRRYGSARELADDLRRFLEDRPIKARRPTYLQRAARWSRRHRSVMVAACATAVLGVLGLLFGAMLLAREQAETKKALLQTQKALDKAEAEHNQRWELFLKAQGHLDYLAELCDTELKDKPELQELRRKALESVKDYYQEFIDHWQEVPPSMQDDLFGSFLHVALILNTFGEQEKALETLERARPYADRLRHSDPNHHNLAALDWTFSSLCSPSGPGPGGRELQLLWEPAVQADLKLTAEQLKQLGPAPDKRREPFGKGWPVKFEDGRARWEELARQQKGLKNVLQPAQAKRLQQIALQLRGVEAFKDPLIAGKLELTLEQKGKVRMLLEPGHFPLPQVGPRRSFGGPGGKKGGGGPKSLQDQVLSLLTTRQKERWQDLVGPPFQGDVRLTPLPRPPDPALNLFQVLHHRPPGHGAPDPRHNPWGGVRRP